MLEGTSQINKTIDGLLILARTEARQIGDSEESVLLPELVKEILDFLEIVIEEPRIDISKEHNGDPIVEVCADRIFARVALLNVLHNALKFSPTARISVSHTRLQSFNRDRQ